MTPDDVSAENLREVREQRRQEGQAGRLNLGRLFRREQPAAGRRFRDAEAAPAEDIERALTSTAEKGLPGLGQRLVDAYHAARRAFTFEYNLREFPVEQDEIRVFQSERRKAFQKAGEDIVGVVGRLADKGEL